MSLVESAAARLGEDPPGFVGSIDTVFSESAQRAAFEITSARGVKLVAKAQLSRESYDREMIRWLTARQCGLSAPRFWYPYFKAEPPYLLTYARSKASPSCGATTRRSDRGQYPAICPQSGAPTRSLTLSREHEARPERPRSL
jgi:hypothetical protein